VTVLSREPEVLENPMSIGNAQEPCTSDRPTFEAEISPLLRPALRIATAMLLDPAAAEDAVQEASLRAWRSRSNRLPGTDLRPWFFAIVANQCRETLRGPWTRVVTADPDAVALNAAPGRLPPSDDILDLRAALRRLSAKDRLAVVLRYYLDLPYDEIASIAGCSVRAAGSRIRRGEAALRSVLAKREN
jgi:RNA polymerase sigma-70 factor, ECF subfamily